MFEHVMFFRSFLAKVENRSEQKAKAAVRTTPKAISRVTPRAFVTPPPKPKLEEMLTDIDPHSEM